MKEYIVSSKVYGKKVILLDDEDYDKIISKNIRLWVNYAPTTRSCYAIFWKNNKRVRLHRWLIECPSDKIVDHINNNTLDNRKCNLRICTHFENMQNRRDNKTGKAGVYYSKRDNVFVARIGTKFIGQSKSLEEAIKMKDKAEKQKGKM